MDKDYLAILGVDIYRKTFMFSYGLECFRDARIWSICKCSFSVFVTSHGIVYYFEMSFWWGNDNMCSIISSIVPQCIVGDKQRTKKTISALDDFPKSLLSKPWWHHHFWTAPYESFQNKRKILQFHFSVWQYTLPPDNPVNKCWCECSSLWMEDFFTSRETCSLVFR